MKTIICLLASTLSSDPSYVAANLSMPATVLELQAPGDKTLRLAPGSATSAGLTVAYRGLTASAGYAFPELNKDREPGSRANDYRLSHAWSRLGFDVNYARYKGFSVVEGENLASAVTAEENRPRPGLDAESAGADLYVYLWDDGFRLTDVLGMVPTKGKGQGFFATVSHDRARLRDGDGVIPASAQPELGEGMGFTEAAMEATSGAVGVGISHDWDGFYLNASTAYGAGRQRVHVASAGEELAVAPTFFRKKNGRAAFGYAGKVLFTGVLIAIEEPEYDLGPVRLKTERHNVMINAGSRF